MHYLAHSITKLCQDRKQWYEGWEGIPVYACSGKEGVFIVVLESGCVWTAYGLVRKYEVGVVTMS